MADRHAPEARALLLRLLGYIDGRVHAVGARAWRDLLGRGDLEDICSEVLLQLVSTSLAQFRGDSLGELLAFVRTMCDRAVWHRARRAIRERDALEGAGAETVRGWVSALAATPEDGASMVADVALSDDDQSYLKALLSAGSKVEFARRQGVSRAAVTQRVHRITDRIHAMAPMEQAAVEAWLHQTARQTLEGPTSG